MSLSVHVSVSLSLSGTLPYLTLPHLRREAEANGLGAVGVPSLRLSDDELRARSPRDLEMFTLLRRTFKQRVRALEDAVGARVWDCKVHGRPHGRPHGRHLADTADAELASIVNASLL